VTAAPSFSVVICSYSMDRWDDLHAAVRSVDAQTLRAAQTIVVTDYAETLLEQAGDAFPEAQVVPNREDRGLSGARNTGVAQATGNVIVFLDDDALAAPDWLERLAVHYATPGVLGVGGAVRPNWPGRRPPWLPLEFDWTVGCSYRGLPESASSVRNLIGANMSFRREVFELIGGFTNGLGRVGGRPMGCEETELAIRLRQACPGAALVYEPEAVVSHRVTPQRTTLRYFISRCWSEGLSKAMVASSVGTKDALESERKHVGRVLPAALRRSLGPGRTEPPARAAAVLAGLGAAAAGFAVGRVAGLGKQRQARIQLQTGHA
jgi:GT2 family glycosyltransferase